MSTTVLAVALLLALGVVPAHAYVDPGTGSLIAQMLFGGLAGLVVVVKLFWRRILVRLGVVAPEPIRNDSGEQA